MTTRHWKRLLTDVPAAAFHLDQIARLYSASKGVSVASARRKLGITTTRRGPSQRRVFFASADPSRL